MIASSAHKSWLNNYIEFFKAVSQGDAYKQMLADIYAADNHEAYMYKFIQPTGLMYGTPVKFTDGDLPQSVHIDEQEKVKMVLVDCLIHCSMVLKHKGEFSETELESFLDDIFKNIGDFYSQVFPGLLADNLSDIDKIIENRVLSNKKWNKNFWASYFQNSLLFLDIIYFSKWMQQADKIKLQNEKEDVYFLIIKIIAASANANSQIEHEEEVLFQNFLASAKLKDENVKMANDYFFKGITLDSIDFDEVDSWIIRKYLLEIAILTIWSDRVLDQAEKNFLNALSAKLGFSETDLEESMAAIESFMLAHWHKIPYLSEHTGYEQLYELLSHRMATVIAKNKDVLLKDITSKKHYMEMLSKTSQGYDLQPEESDKLHAFMLEMVKDVPSLAVFLLPGGTTLLPILFKNIVTDLPTE